MSIDDLGYLRRSYKRRKKHPTSQDVNRIVRESQDLYEEFPIQSPFYETLRGIKESIFSRPSSRTEKSDVLNFETDYLFSYRGLGIA